MSNDLFDRNLSGLRMELHPKGAGESPRVFRRLKSLRGLSMKKSNKFSPEVRERAVRMVQEHRGEYPSLWAAVESIAPKIGC
ncbi:MAG: transposase family protein, partial [Ramlibacter sp.]|nr:transposase family protein [Ramlibacter sp.]